MAALSSRCFNGATCTMEGCECPRQYAWKALSRQWQKGCSWQALNAPLQKTTRSGLHECMRMHTNPAGDVHAWLVHGPDAGSGTATAWVFSPAATGQSAGACTLRANGARRTTHSLSCRHSSTQGDTPGSSSWCGPSCGATYSGQQQQEQDEGNWPPAQQQQQPLAPHRLYPCRHPWAHELPAAGAQKFQRTERLLAVHGKGGRVVVCTPPAAVHGAHGPLRTVQVALKSSCMGWCTLLQL
jgi:hypothetical protein